MKIICVGNPKTATTSLKKAMDILGLNTIGFDENYIRFWTNETIDPCLLKVNEFEFLKDWPWRQCYKEIDSNYKNCKFILTLRNPDDWVESYISHINKDIKYVEFNKLMTIARKKAYGFDPCLHIDNKKFLIENLYEKQNEEIRNYFKNRKNDLLEIDLIKNPSFDIICDFIEFSVPNKEFPHENKKNKL